ncbi:uncharacterized protein HD556DRAFT_1308508 [Suillus plorans]|uniref:Uncharacterized protein n=1 Tax=Suillus plorans TaxID=116603 RepID=A0A9P7APF3_9AGAM|nr:uncharacterized protein HD556DRAFT_1308508 [Suillus plorans]KAG1793659.1 hypothetical protein HD556DRAFT_1308508 [Suillus plorans]
MYLVEKIHEQIVDSKRGPPQVVLSDSESMLSDYELVITKEPSVKPQVDSPLRPWRTKCFNTGKVGSASQLRKVGDAVIDAPARRTGKGQQFVIPDGEPENIIAPSPVKKRTCMKGSKAAVPAVRIPDPSDDTENGGRFRLQKNPIPPGYVSLQPLGLEEHPGCPYATARVWVTRTGHSACRLGSGWGVAFHVDPPSSLSHAPASVSVTRGYTLDGLYPGSLLRYQLCNPYPCCGCGFTSGCRCPKSYIQQDQPKTIHLVSVVKMGVKWAASRGY